ncbi:MAG: diaminopimelate decarboxylase [Pseudomonadota bacterium]
MHHFAYQEGLLHAEEVSLTDIAAEVGTPFYCYSAATLNRHASVLTDAFAGTDHLICYAVKANSNQAILRLLAARGLGMDVVSEGELRRARDAGVPGSKIIFAGVGKQADEMRYALSQNILSFNVESAAELDMLSAVAASENRTANIAIRVNPDVDAKTHAKISTGKSENKFGVPFEEAAALYARAADLPGIAINGIHMHIGSQIYDLEPFSQAFRRMRELTMTLTSAGHAIAHLDLGGGLGVPDRFGNAPPPSPAEYATIVKRELGDLGLPFVLEPGRMLVANAGILVTRVVYAKPSPTKTFTIVDAGMNDLIRPTLYDAHHEVWPVDESRRDDLPVTQDIVGPVCESGDYLAVGRQLPAFRSDDLIALMTSGAYGAVMASTYNTRPLVPEVLVSGKQFDVIRPRQTYEELIALDNVPEWL